MATKSKKTEPAASAAPTATSINFALLAAIVAATAGPAGFMNANPEEANKLGALGYVEVNPDPQYAVNDQPAVRATAAGAAAAAANPVAAAPAVQAAAPAWGAAPAAGAVAQTAVAAAAPAVVVKPEYAIVAFELPAAVRGTGGNLGIRSETYPFSKLELGQAFFIAATAEKPNPEKAYASTVASATERYASEDTTQAKVKNRKGAEVHPKKYERKFAIRRVEDGAPFGFPGVKGAAVGRIA